MEFLLELLERAREARRAVGGGDPEHARSRRRIELEHDPKRDRLALAGREHRERRLELRRQAFGERLRARLGHRGAFLAAEAAALGADVVERDSPRELT